MTLQASGAISLTDVLNELRIANSGRGATISLGDSDVLSLAGKGGAPLSLSDLYGKSAFSATGNNSYNQGIMTGTSGGTAYTYPSVTVKGSGNYSYSWTITTNTGSATLSNATSQQATVSHTYVKQGSGSYDVFLQCVVTDNVAGKSITVTNIEAAADWSGTM